MKKIKHSPTTEKHFDKKGKLIKTKIIPAKPERRFDWAGKLYEVKKPSEEKLYLKRKPPAKLKTYPQEVLEAIKLAIKDLPNSIIYELSAFFEPSVVAKLLELYSGETVTFPKFETVWNNYRNRFIKQELDKQNDKKTRERLHLKFEISTKRVSEIYGYMKKRKTIKMSDARIKSFVKKVYKVERGKLMEDLKKVLESKDKAKF